MRTRFLKSLVSLSLHHRRKVLVATVLLTLVSIGLSSRLGMNFQWTNLLPDDMPIVTEFKRIDQDFNNPGNYIVVLEADDPVRLEAATDAVIEILESNDEWVTLVQGRLPENYMVDNGLRLASPSDLEASIHMLSDPRLVSMLSRFDLATKMMSLMPAETIADSEEEVIRLAMGLESLARSLEASLDGHPVEVDRAVRDLTTGNPYFLSMDGKMSLVMAASTASMDEFDKLPQMDVALEKALDSMAERFPDVSVGRTGMIPIGRAEMESTTTGTVALTLAALVLVFVMLRWNFGDWWTPMLALLPVVLGIFWSMGFYAVTIGSLNIMTAMIMLVLVGLGIDFSIHLLNRFREERARGSSVDDSITEAVVGTGRGILTGAITTAVAFFAIMISDSRGIVEFGFCAGSGVLFTLFAVLLTLPCMVVWRELRGVRKKKAIVAPELRAIGTATKGVVRLRWAILPLALAAIIFGVRSARLIDFEYNFLALEPQVEEVFLQEKIVDRFGMSTELASLTATSVEESRKFAGLFRAKKEVGGVDDISLWLPRPEWQEKNDAVIARLGAMLRAPREPNLPSAAGSDKMISQINSLRGTLAALGKRISNTDMKRATAVLERIAGDGGALANLSARIHADDRTMAALDTYAQSFESTMAARLQRMTAKSGPVTVDDLPESLLQRYRSPTTGRFMIQAFPRGYVFEREPLEAFAAATSSIDPAVTGMPQLMLEMNATMVRDGARATGAAALAIFMLLLIDFRRLTPAILAMLPLAIGVSLMLLIMWLTGMKYNFVNLIAIPIIIGIGVDNGVHVLHRYLESGRDELATAMTSVGRAILMTSLTTMIGFGNIAFYAHPGMASLGVLLFIGVAACLVATLVIMPALASLMAGLLFRAGRTPSATRTAAGVR